MKKRNLAVLLLWAVLTGAAWLLPARELSEAEIAHRAADDIRFKSGIAQFRNDSRRSGEHAAFPDIPVDFERYLHKKSLPAFEFLSFHA